MSVTIFASVGDKVGLNKILIFILLGAVLTNCAPDENAVERERVLQQKTKLCFPGADLSGNTCLYTTRLGLMDTPEHYEYPPVEQSKLSFDYSPPIRFVDLLYVKKDDHLSPNFKVQEFMSFHKGRYGVVQPKMIYALEQIRAELGRPLSITSGFRSPFYNSQIVNAATHSRHMYGDAVDFKVAGVAKSKVRSLCKKYGANFVQVYKTHIHCDWRTELSVKHDHLHDELEGQIETLESTKFSEND